MKDQTYFLSHMSQSQMQKCLFPLGPLPKAEVRKLALSMNLPTKDRPDSQGICFLGKIKYNDFVKFHLGERSGEIQEWETGKVLGKHHGFWFHTYGQRKGLRLHGGPWFVVDKDCDKNIVYVSHLDLLQEVARREFIATDVNWISGAPEDLNLRVKLRHGPRMTNAKLQLLEHGNYNVQIEEPDSGLAHGQFCVFYRDDVCLGAGMIRLLPVRRANTP